MASRARPIKAAATICFKPFPLDDALRGLADAGFVNVEIGAVKGEVEHVDPDELDAAAARGIERLLEQHGLRVVSFSGHSHLDTDVGRERLLRVVRAAGELGALAVNTYTGDADTPERRAAFVTNVRAVADEAARRGVLVCLETDSNLLPTAEVGRVILAEIDHPAVKLNYDGANVVFYTDDVRPERDVKHALGALGHVHLKDKRGGKGVLDFPALGDGELDITAILGPIYESQFDGPISMEIEFGHQWPDWDTCLAAARRGKAYWDALEQNGQLIV
jgi:L-ribulose-5-phosphate 3-epimerase